MNWYSIIADLKAEMQLDRDYCPEKGWNCPSNASMTRAISYAVKCNGQGIDPPEATEEDGDGGLVFVFPDFRKEFRHQ